MSAHRAPRPDPAPAAAGGVVVPPAPLVPVGSTGPVDRVLAERHRDELDLDARVERRLTWRELGCLLFVALFVLVRARYLV